MNYLIKYHGPDADDPDWYVKCCYALLIAATSEIECGIDNLWKRRQYNGRRSYPYFGQYVPIASLKVFRSAAAYEQADKKFWYL